MQKKGVEVPSLAQAEELARFWRDAGAKRWFAKDAAFDDEFRRRFEPLHFSVARRECDHWLGQPYANLALILLSDQFPRNAFRGTAHMYATDSLARYYTLAFIAAGFLDRISDDLKLFVCVPFIHSESLDDQVHGLDLYRKHAPDGVQWAIEHHDIIQRFGRFPHRNAELGRISTPQEQRFLDEGGFAG